MRLFIWPASLLTAARLLAVCGLALLLCLPARAQSEPLVPGYIITPQADTLRGYVSNRSDRRAAQGVTFRAPLDDASEEEIEPEEFTPDDLLGYGIDGGRHFETLTVSPFPGQPSQALFAQPVVRGDRLSLFVFYAASPTLFYPDELGDRGDPTRYAVRSASGTVTGLYYLRRMSQEGQMRLARDRDYQSALAEVVAACPDAQQRASRAPYRRQALADVVGEYNDCVGAGTIVQLAAPRRAGPPFSTTYSAQLRVGSQQMRLSRAAIPPSFTRPQPLLLATVGAEVTAEPRLSRAPTSRLSVPLSLSADLITPLSSSWPSADSPALSPGEQAFADLLDSFEFTRMRLGISYGVRYRFASTPQSPYARVGAGMGFHVQPFEVENPYFRHRPWDSSLHVEVGGFSLPVLAASRLGVRYEHTTLGFIRRHLTPITALGEGPWTMSTVSAVVNVPL